MNPSIQRASVQTASGHISYLQTADTGPVALFIHGVLVNGYLWRHQLSALADLRRCVAIDLMGHGHTTIAADQAVSFEAQAEMVREFLDALSIDQVDLVANDSGTGVAQIFAARYPDRLRSLTLTNGDVQDNWPPANFSGFLDMVKAGGLPQTLRRMLEDKDFFRGPDAMEGAYERSSDVSDETIETYIRPHLASPERTQDLVRFILAFDHSQTVKIERALRGVAVPALVVWGTGDIFFGKEWSDFLARTLGGPVTQLEVANARLLFPEERAKELNEALRAFWTQED
ncbi:MULTISPECIES: alpha/beta hydrolase [unclassified Stenotrophomonas]|uniref:alpha/beta fold hydrolase n=1 Tax=unclassified Stenotrophomonas TaxID=196198 RepID=UPI0024B5FE0D|nr:MULTISPECIES: alpha/beta hydrolase [unclassified Stenotrophomonas]MDI9248313.1 alpha/beta hydrolase [Stenotrophomonas sp. RS-48]MDI9271803.1 alpha/beta hydrolase [Stenotrophomonas sp. PFBMAA-4]